KVIGPTSSRHTIEGQLVGTPHYLSPEQTTSATVTMKTDVYSLGVMAYELFLEALPFEASTAAEVMMMHMRATPAPPSELWPCIPAQLEVLLLAMLAKLPADRPSIAEVIDRLEQVRSELAHRRLLPSRFLGEWTTPRRRTSAIRSAVAILGTIPPAFAAQGGRWRYAAGALALAASAAVFAFTRGGSPQAAAASISNIEPMPALAPGDLPDFEIDVRGTTPPRDVTSESQRERSRPTHATSSVTPASARGAQPQSDPPRPRPSAPTDRDERAAMKNHRRARHLATPKLPVAPHRASALDPDGTIDSYR
ncbi:MAG: serine/threonine protein kinase, partial [Kofleriaceae bacterium]